MSKDFLNLASSINALKVNDVVQHIVSSSKSASPTALFSSYSANPLMSTSTIKAYTLAITFPIIMALKAARFMGYFGL